MKLVDAVAAIDGLPERTKAIEEAVHVHGISVHTIARALALSEDQVRQHLRAARDARALLVVAGCVGENRLARLVTQEQAVRVDVAEVDPARQAWLSGKGPAESYTATALFGVH